MLSSAAQDTTPGPDCVNKTDKEFTLGKTLTTLIRGIGVYVGYGDVEGLLLGVYVGKVVGMLLGSYVGGEVGVLVGVLVGSTVGTLGRAVGWC